MIGTGGENHEWTSENEWVYFTAGD